MLAHMTEAVANTYKQFWFRSRWYRNLSRLGNPDAATTDAYKLNISSKKKLQIMSMFSVNFVITIVSCLRLWAFVEFAQTTNPTCKQLAHVVHVVADMEYADDNVSGLYWCATELNLFTIVACMPAIHAIFHKALRKARGTSTYASRGQCGSEGPRKGSYLRHNIDQRKNSIPFEAIKKATGVTVYRIERSGSDVELVDNREAV